jgi:hypothetical protein
MIILPLFLSFFFFLNYLCKCVWYFIARSILCRFNKFIATPWLSYFSKAIFLLRITFYLPIKPNRQDSQVLLVPSIARHLRTLSILTFNIAWLSIMVVVYLPHPIEYPPLTPRSEPKEIPEEEE